MKKLNYIMVAVLLIGCAACNPKQENKETATLQEKPTIEKTLQKVEPEKLVGNPIDLFKNSWFVLTAGKDTSFNQMTIGWGTMGNLWGEPIVTVYVNSNRYTYSFIENSRYFTICAFDEEYRDKVKFIGSHSGKDTNKIAATGFTPIKTELGSMYYQEARLVIECEKIYANEITPSKIADTSITNKFYAAKDKGMHKMYVGKIVNMWEKK